MSGADNGDGFGAALRRARKACRATMGDVARLLGVSVSFVSDVELGRRAPLSADRIARFGNHYGIDTDDLMKRAARHRGSFSLVPRTESQADAAAVIARALPLLDDDDAEDVIRSLRQILRRSGHKL